MSVLTARFSVLLIPCGRPLKSSSLHFGLLRSLLLVYQLVLNSNKNPNMLFHKAGNIVDLQISSLVGAGIEESLVIK